MARPSMAPQRRAQILEAFERCIERAGLDGVTLQTVADEAGVKRSAIRHFVGNRDALIREAVVHLTERYQAAFESWVAQVPRRDRMRSALHFMFEGGFASDHRKSDRTLSLLVAASYNDETPRRALREMYEHFEDRLREELRDAYPNAPESRLREVGYAVMCLAEHNVTLLNLGFDSGRGVDARRAAEALVAQLNSPNSDPSNMSVRGGP